MVAFALKNLPTITLNKEEKQIAQCNFHHSVMRGIVVSPTA
jgi:hypothetical protein